MWEGFSAKTIIYKLYNIHLQLQEYHLKLHQECEVYPAPLKSIMRLLCGAAQVEMCCSVLWVKWIYTLNWEVILPEHTRNKLHLKMTFWVFHYHTTSQVSSCKCTELPKRAVDAVHDTSCLLQCLLSQQWSTYTPDSSIRWWCTQRVCVHVCTVCENTGLPRSCSFTLLCLW